MEYSRVFTVFTPTFNRADTLARVYKSLQAQTFEDFEWIIVDDGSTDGTRELVSEWMKAGILPVRYFWQENGGKHRAFNRAVQMSMGELFLPLDSDDECVPVALERLKHYWDSIGQTERKSFSAVTALCMDRQGRILGDKFPDDVFDSDAIELADRYAIGGDKWGFQRTDILKKLVFPEIDNEYFVPEGLVWNRIAKLYRTRYVNECLSIVHYQSDGLTAKSAALRIKNPKGTLLYYRELFESKITTKSKIKAAINYIRFSLHSGGTFNEMSRGGGLGYILISVIPAVYFFVRDRVRLTGTFTCQK